MPSEKGHELKVYNNIKFSKSKETKVGQKLTCIKKMCKAHIFTDLEGKNFIKLVNDHVHEVDPNLARQILSNSVKRKAVDDISSRPAKHVRKELILLTEEVREKISVSDLLRSRKNCYAQKRAVFPALPKNI